MSVDVLAVIYAPLEKYPPSVNQVALLAESGLQVVVIDCFHPNVRRLEFSGDNPVVRISGSRYTEQFREPLRNRGIRLLRLCQFKYRLNRLIKQLLPKVIIAYDTYAFYLVGNLSDIYPRPRLVWHFHELPGFVSQTKLGGMVGRAEKFIRIQAHSTDMWIVPDYDRAEHLSQLIPPPHDHFIAMNCPRRLELLPRGKLKQRLRDISFKPQKIVLFQGAIEQNRCIETIIRSLHVWPLCAGLVLLGPVESSYKSRLLQLAADTGHESRVTFLDPVPYSEVLSHTVDADVACCLVHEKGNKNWEYSAGAVNKRFEYMAAGVPQVTNGGAGMSRIISERNTGLLVDPRNSEQVGRAIKALLDDSSMHAQIAQNARNSHLSVFNYEAQFQNPLERLTKWARSESKSAATNVP